MKIFLFSLWQTLGLVACMLFVASPGCGSSPDRTLVNESVAIEACETFLDTWREGLTPQDLQPRILGSDYVWDSGFKLISYELLPDEKNHGTTLEISARLTLEDGKGVITKSNAIYTVGTSPEVTVIRKDPMSSFPDESPHNH